MFIVKLLRPRWGFIVYLIVSLPGFGAFAVDKTKPPCAFYLTNRRAPEERRDQLVEVWRYYGQSDFKNSNYFEYSFSAKSGRPNLLEKGETNANGRYYSENFLRPTYNNLIRNNPVYTQIENFKKNHNEKNSEYSLESELQSPDTGSLLDMNQDFPLKLFSSINYLDGHGAKEQRQIAHSLNPAQVTFFAVKEERSLEELIAEFGQIPPTAFESPDSRSFRDYFNSYADSVERHAGDFQLVVGTTWLISGQNSSQVFSLGLENNNLVRPLNRKETPWVWEIGRAAQTTKNGFDTAMKMAISVALNEAIIDQRDIDKSYIFCHALDKARAALFRRKYKMNIFSAYKNSQELVLNISLREAIKLIAGAKPVNDYVEGIRQRINFQAAKKSTVKFAGKEIEYRDFTGVPESQLTVRISDVRPMMYSFRDIAPAAISHHAYSDRVWVNSGIYRYGDFSFKKLIEILSERNAFELALPTADISVEDVRVLIAQAAKYLVARSPDLQAAKKTSIALTAPTNIYFSTDAKFDEAKFSEAQFGERVYLATKGELFTNQRIGLMSYRQTISRAYYLETRLIQVEDIMNWPEYEKAPALAPDRDYLKANLIGNL